MAVNVSATNLLEDGWTEGVLDALAMHGVRPDRFVVEITEDVLMTDPDRSLTALAALSAAGVRVALDDFGTGYSSLGYLSRLPVDILKLDRAFLAGDDPNLIAAVVQLGQALALEVVAEGIEEDEQWRALRALGCAYGQGFLFSRPLNAADSLASVA
jgi:EAL domain-containing protein (putative c-di-GMP-specific phosphodiesterase class I)